MVEMKFNTGFWKDQLVDLGYHLSESNIPSQFLRDRRAIPPGISLKEAKLLYQDPLGIDIIILEFDKLPSRIGASKIARYWKAHQGGRQLIIFTDNNESYAIVIPDAIETSDTKLRILSLSEKLYRTDREALESLRFVKDNKKFRELYDQQFLPYERVRKEFFEAYRDLYKETVEVINPVMEAYSNSYAQRFLGRLMFLYFLQRKGWLKGKKSFVDSIKDYSDLNWVFYVGLSSEGNPGLPYLDGTLFEREEYLSAEREKEISDKMDEIFKKARELFNQYNFTVDELTSKEVEVSLDPAMIGTIFENMLPENERGSKGTFYTPPEEISFICRRALASYLKIPEFVEKIGEKESLKDGISTLIKKLNDEKSEKEVRELRDKILSITVLDPAVGSGGFLLGMMQEMIDLLRQADESVNWHPDIEQYKSRILQNLFGFDIEDEAIEIARLRIWLSMIVDKKEAEPLQSLDLNIVKISDSLIKSGGVQSKLGDELESTWDDMRNIREKFATAKKSEARIKLRNELQKIQSDIKKKTGVTGGIIESWVPKRVDIVVMNPPYVRQESIPAESKKYYTSNYKIDKKSDLYCYFVMRALQLINQDGIVSVISSDKWLETGYGESLQKMLSSRLIGIYGQRERVFEADINSIIFVYSNQTDSSKTMDFIYLEDYLSLAVRNHVQFKRQDLNPGKWFYLRAPKMFMEKIYPKLTRKLGDFVDIKRGFTTGANDFFYMKDVSAQYESDYLSNSKKFEECGVKAKNEKELRDQGLIYIENEGGVRFVVDKKDVTFVMRSPKGVNKRLIDKLETLVLYTKTPGQITKTYIEWGEKAPVKITKGRKKGEETHGYHNLETSKARDPWYSISREIKPTYVLLVRFVLNRHFDVLSKQKILTDQTQNLLYPKKSIDPGSHSTEFENSVLIWSYSNSVIFFITKELYGMRMGGAVLQLYTEVFCKMPVPDLSKLVIPHNYEPLDIVDVKTIHREVQTPNRRNFDIMILKSLGLEDAESLIDELYAELIEMVDDRLMKGKRQINIGEGNDEQDN